MNEILTTIVVGVILAIVTQLISHHLAMQRDKAKLDQDCEEDRDKMKNES